MMACQSKDDILRALGFASVVFLVIMCLLLTCAKHCLVDGVLVLWNAYVCRQGSIKPARQATDSGMHM